MRVKAHALLCDPAQSGERKHLKTARIRQDRMRPVHKPMQAAHVAHDLLARTQVEVIGVRELHLAADRLEVARGDRRP